MDWTMKTDPVTPNLVVKLLFPLAFTSPIYTLRDIWPLLAGFIATQREMFDEYLNYDAGRFGHRFEIPVVIVQGATDVLTITELAEEYYGVIEAPAKTLALIDGASHFAAFTRPEAFLVELDRAVGRGAASH
jgi:pimeloyl-ACP methyl ester carboxylesterase